MDVSESKRVIFISYQLTQSHPSSIKRSTYLFDDLHTISFLIIHNFVKKGIKYNCLSIYTNKSLYVKCLFLEIFSYRYCKQIL